MQNSNKIQKFQYLLFMFLFVGVLGWCLEFVFRTIYYGEVTIPGFLIGPFCSIYGLACLLFTVFCKGRSKTAVFLISFFGASVLEVIIHTVFLKVFNVMLWDYRDIPLHLGPSISLPFSLAWGFLGMLFVYVIEPRIYKLYMKFKPVFDKINIVTVVLLLTDFTVSVLMRFGVID